MPLDLDTRVRLAAFEFLRQQTGRYGTELPRDVLAHGFMFEAQRIPLLAPQGIFKPALLPEVPLSITTAPPSERKPAAYDDRLEHDGVLAYRYRGTDPMHRDNVGLRLAMLREAPLAYFFGMVPGRYEAIWPVFVIGDDPDRLTFTVVVDDSAFAHMDGTRADVMTEPRRRYVTTLVQRRLHQQAFRERVLLAYGERCGICRLRHRELLDAAHILPDRHLRGEPLISNGLALCSLHHAAFDRQVMGVRADLVVEVRDDVLREIDGPMLLHGLQGFKALDLSYHDARITSRIGTSWQSVMSCSAKQVELSWPAAHPGPHGYTCDCLNRPQEAVPCISLFLLLLADPPLVDRHRVRSQQVARIASACVQRRAFGVLQRRDGSLQPPITPANAATRA